MRNINVVKRMCGVGILSHSKTTNWQKMWILARLWARLTARPSTYGFLHLKWLLFSGQIRRVFSCPRPFHTAFFLLRPFPLQFAVPHQLSPFEILARPEIVMEYRCKVLDYALLRGVYLFSFRDTPLRSLYRLYETTCAAEHGEMMLEAAYFWRHQDWRIEDIPDPHDSDPLRYAIIASLVEELVSAFNFKIDLGLRRGVHLHRKADRIAARTAIDKPFERCPNWTSAVPPVKDQVSFLKNADSPPYPHFLKRNILANVHQFRNV